MAPGTQLFGQRTPFAQISTPLGSRAGCKANRD